MIMEVITRNCPESQKYWNNNVGDYICQNFHYNEGWQFLSGGWLILWCVIFVLGSAYLGAFHPKVLVGIIGFVALMVWIHRDPPENQR